LSVDLLILEQNKPVRMYYGSGTVAHTAS